MKSVKLGKPSQPSQTPPPSWEKISLIGDFFAGYNSKSKRLGNHPLLQDPPPFWDGFPSLTGYEI